MSASRSSRTWEDDAWKIDSDDDEFVKASRAGSTVPRPQRNGSASSASRGDEKARQHALPSERQLAAKSQRHAPPARPHPYPTGEAERRSLTVADAARQGGGNGGRSRSSSSSKSVDASSSGQGGGGGGGGALPEGQATGGQWTLVERSSSMGSAQANTRVQARDDANGTQALNESALEEHDELSEAHSPKLARDARVKAEFAAIQDDLNDVLNDPTAVLARLSIARHGSRSSSRSKDGTSHAGHATPSSSSALDRHGSNSSYDASRKNKSTFDTTNAVVAVDGIVTTLPASSDHFDASSLDIPGRDVVVLSDPAIERKHSIRSERRKAGFIRCLHQDVIPMDELRTLAWAGVPDDVRPMVWMLLLGYLPPSKAVRSQTLARKRAEYVSGVRNAFQRGTEELDQAIWHQIHIDVPRTNPGITLWQRQATQRALERILYVWAIRHPASGYVQGINDLATPFFEVFLSAYISTDPELYDVALLPPSALEALEADTFWCLSKLLDGIQDNYIFAQPGIQRQVRRMGELVARINPALHGHFEEQSVEYMQFAFRWMNCLLMRELSVLNIVRMWDSYLAEGPDAFSEFHLFVCAAFLDRWSDELRRMDFQGIIMFLQSLPTQNWTAKETELLLADAFVKKSLFGGTAHLTN